MRAPVPQMNHGQDAHGTSTPPRISPFGGGGTPEGVLGEDSWLPETEFSRQRTMSRTAHPQVMKTEMTGEGTGPTHESWARCAWHTDACATGARFRAPMGMESPVAGAQRRVCLTLPVRAPYNTDSLSLRPLLVEYGMIAHCMYLAPGPCEAVRPMRPARASLLIECAKGSPRGGTKRRNYHGVFGRVGHQQTVRGNGGP